MISGLVGVLRMMCKIWRRNMGRGGEVLRTIMKLVMDAMRGGGDGHANALRGHDHGQGEGVEMDMLKGDMRMVMD